MDGKSLHRATVLQFANHLPQLARSQVAEAVGIIGVIGSLIFVGGELRQNAIATRAATNAEVSVAFVDLNLMLASNPDLARAFSAHAADPASAPIEAQILLLGSWRALSHIWSNVH